VLVQSYVKLGIAAFAIFMFGAPAGAELVINSTQLHYGSHRQRIAQASSPDGLVVMRTNTNRNNPAAPPFSKTITDLSAVEKLYAEIAALPLFPAGPVNCPNDVGIRYHLKFYSGTALLLVADDKPTGCPSVQLSDGSIRSDADGSFANDLSRVLGFSSRQQFLGLS
jgi:hypothetical protein